MPSSAAGTASQLALSAGFRNEAYLRAGSLAVGAYEYICTLPAEYRFYRAQSLQRGLSQQFFLFVLIRYMSVAVIIISNVGFFGQFSSLAACQRFMLVSPVLKALQTIVSQLILSTRTYSISRKSRWVLWTMLVTIVISSALEFFADIYQRTPIHNPITLNCISGNASKRIAWINYAVAMVFDMVAICISTGYLWAYRSIAARISRFIQTLLYEGLGYFAALTAVNIFNLILYLRAGEGTQSSGASLGYVIIFILSQRILIRQRDYADKYAKSSTDCEVTLPLDTTREINDALRSQLEITTAAGKAAPLGDNAFAIASLRSSSTCEAPPHPYPYHYPPGGAAWREAGEPQSEFDVRVRIERTVVVERNPDVLLRENYRHPRVMWGREDMRSLGVRSAQ
ncbi:hypothetical protein M0805_009798 [Coniferiporia weirii]|nr:hypothetical protein M0805_009798 [Coniferiporia weirii]